MPTAMSAQCVRVCLLLLLPTYLYSSCLLLSGVGIE